VRRTSYRRTTYRPQIVRGVPTLAASKPRVADKPVTADKPECPVCHAGVRVLTSGVRGSHAMGGGTCRNLNSIPCPGSGQAVA
jgi:hypothetical protein